MLYHNQASAVHNLHIIKVFLFSLKLGDKASIGKKSPKDAKL